MKRLFDISKGKIVLNPSTLWIPEFKVIWDRDKNKEKAGAMQELSYIVFLCDYRSPYRDLRENVREATIKKDMFGDSKWKPDKEISKAIEKYVLLQETANTRLLKAAKTAADKLTMYFEDVDPSEANNIVRNLKELGAVVKSLDTLQKQVEKEQLDLESARGNREVGHYEDPNR